MQRQNIFVFRMHNVFAPILDSLALPNDIINEAKRAEQGWIAKLLAGCTVRLQNGNQYKLSNDDIRTNYLRLMTYKNADVLLKFVMDAQGKESYFLLNFTEIFDRTEIFKIINFLIKSNFSAFKRLYSTNNIKSFLNGNKIKINNLETKITTCEILDIIKSCLHNNENDFAKNFWTQHKGRLQLSKKSISTAEHREILQAILKAYTNVSTLLTEYVHLVANLDSLVQVLPTLGQMTKQSIKKLLKERIETLTISTENQAIATTNTQFFLADHPIDTNSYDLNLYAVDTEALPSDNQIAPQDNYSLTVVPATEHAESLSALRWPNHQSLADHSAHEIAISLRDNFVQAINTGDINTAERLLQNESIKEWMLGGSLEPPKIATSDCISQTEILALFILALEKSSRLIVLTCLQNKYVMQAFTDLSAGKKSVFTNEETIYIFNLMLKNKLSPFCQSMFPHPLIQAWFKRREVNFGDEQNPIKYQISNEELIEAFILSLEASLPDLANLIFQHETIKRYLKGESVASQRDNKASLIISKAEISKIMSLTQYNFTYLYIHLHMQSQPSILMTPHKRTADAAFAYPVSTSGATVTANHTFFANKAQKTAANQQASNQTLPANYRTPWL